MISPFNYEFDLKLTCDSCEIVTHNRGTIEWHLSNIQESGWPICPKCGDDMEGCIVDHDPPKSNGTMVYKVIGGSMRMALIVDSLTGLLEDVSGENVVDDLSTWKTSEESARKYYLLNQSSGSQQ